MPLELGELRAVREVPDDDGVVVLLPDASRSPSSAARLPSTPDRVPLELGELRASARLQMMMAAVLTTRREPIPMSAALHRTTVSCAPRAWPAARSSARFQMMSSLEPASSTMTRPDAMRRRRARPGS